MGDSITRMAFHLQLREKHRKWKVEKLKELINHKKRKLTEIYKNHKKRKLHEIYETEEKGSYTTVEEEEYAEACQGTRTPARGDADNITSIKVKFPPGKKEEMVHIVTATLSQHVITGNLEEVEKGQRLLAWIATWE